MRGAVRTPCSRTTCPPERAWLHGGSALPGSGGASLMGTVVAALAISGTFRWEVQELPREAAPEVACQPLQSAEHRLLSAAPAHSRRASATCSCPSSLPGLGLPQKARIQRNGAIWLSSRSWCLF